MTDHPKFSRRSALAGAAVAPFAFAGAASAGAPMLGASMPQYFRVKLGDFEVTNMLVGSRTVENPQGIFGMNVDAATFDAACADAGIPNDKAQFFFHPPVVNTGSELVLFDTGLQGAGTVAALQAAGYSAPSSCAGSLPLLPTAAKMSAPWHRA